MVDEAGVDVVDVPERNRYEARLGGELAGFAEYHRRDGSIALYHTEVARAYTGRGLASRLIRHVLDDAAAHGLAVLPYCPFVREYIASHAQKYLPLVPTDRTAEFNL